MTFPDCGRDMACRCVTDPAPTPHRAFDPRSTCSRCGTRSALYDAFPCCAPGCGETLCPSCIPAHALDCSEPVLHAGECGCPSCDAEVARATRGEVTA